MTDFSEVKIQAVRDYWNHRPCNVRHSPSPIGTREYFDEVEARKYLVEPHIPAFAEFDKWAGKKVLEIGCGIGTDTINFARAGAHVTAVDLSGESLELARMRARIFGLSDCITFVEADAERLSESVAPQAFDLVYSFGVIHHSPHPEKIIDEVRLHFCAAGTTLKVMVYHRYSWKVLSLLMRADAQFWNLDAIVARHSEARGGCPVTYSYSRSAVRRLIGEGFKIDSQFVEHIFPYRVSKYIKYEYQEEWYWRALPERVFRKLAATVGWHLCVTATAR